MPSKREWIFWGDNGRDVDIRRVEAADAHEAFHAAGRKSNVKLREETPGVFFNDKYADEAVFDMIQPEARAWLLQEAIDYLIDSK